MVNLSRARLLALLLFFSIFAVQTTAAASPKKVSAPARREDVPFIKCQVCQKIAHQIHAQVQKMEAEIAPKKVSEFKIIEIAENVCNLKKQQADWILQIDIVEKGDKLELVEQGMEGQCNSECKTIERACQEVMGYIDTDVAEYFFKHRPSVALLSKFLCDDLSKACLVEPPPVPKDRVPGDPFAAKPSKDAEMEKILRSMQDMPGAPSMKMYSREDLMNNNFAGDEADNDEDEDEDEDENDFPKNLGKVLKNKEHPKKDFRQRITEGIKETQKQMKTYINTASRSIRKWWNKRKSSAKSKKKDKVEL